MIRVVLGEDSFIVREGLRELLEARPEVDVVAACAELDELLDAVQEHEPDVVMTDVRMPPTKSDEGIRAAAKLRESHPEVGVVVLSQYSDPGYVLALFESGSDRRAYLLKERVHDLEELTGALEAVAAGGSVIDPKIVDVLVSARAAAGGGLEALSSRERAVLAEIAQGKSNAAIAGSMQLSKRAVEKHTHAIFTKLGLASSADVSRRVKAALLFLADGADRGRSA